MAGIREKRTFFSLFCCFVRQTSDAIIIIYSISSKRTLGFFFPPIPENNSLAVYLSTPGFHLSLSLSVHERIRTLVVGRLFFLFFSFCIFTLAELSASQTVWKQSRVPPTNVPPATPGATRASLPYPIASKLSLSLWLYKGKSKLDIIYCRRREREGETTSGRYDDAGLGQTQHAAQHSPCGLTSNTLQLAY